MVRKLLILSVVGVGAMLMGASNANAQWGHYGGGFGHSIHSGGFHSGHSASYGFGGVRTISPSYHSWHSGGHSSNYHAPAPVWHDTSHLDYHAPSIQRHGLHFHVTPGHYDVHRQGHWDAGHH